MAVARSYEKLEISGEPFNENGRMYVYVITPKGNKKVRWYTEAEYTKMYGDEIKENGKRDIMDFNARHVFGFGEDGYITIYAGDQSTLEQFVESHHESFRRNLTFGYYTPSHIPVCTLPAGITPTRLNWEDVMDYDDRMKPHEEVQKIVHKLLYNEEPEFTSVYQGEIGSWIERDLVVYSKDKEKSRFGDKYSYLLMDAAGNLYQWETGAKNYATGASKRLKMKVKEYKEINGNEVTVVWYCKEI